MWLDNLVWIVFYSAVYVGVNSALAIFIDKRVGNFWLWFLSFCFLPVIGHFFAIIYLTVFLPKRKKELMRFSKNHSLGLLVDNLQKKSGSHSSVTPFEGGPTVTPFGSESEADSPKIGLDGKPIK
jgi:hypothetical protein